MNQSNVLKTVIDATSKTTLLLNEIRNLCISFPQDNWVADVRRIIDKGIAINEGVFETFGQNLNLEKNNEVPKILSIWDGKKGDKINQYKVTIELPDYMIEKNKNAGEFEMTLELPDTMTTEAEKKLLQEKILIEMNKYITKNDLDISKLKINASAWSNMGATNLKKIPSDKVSKLKNEKSTNKNKSRRR